MKNADHWLQYLRAEGVVIAQTRVKGDWGVRMEQREGTYFHFLAQGCAYFSLDGEHEQLLHSGDLILLPQGAAHQLRHSPDSAVMTLSQFVEDSYKIRSKDPDATNVMCGSFGIDRLMLLPAIKSLPQALHLKADAGCVPSPIVETLKQLRNEVESARLGGKMIVRNLLSTLFVYVLREWSETAPAGAGTWFAAMQNPHIAKALAGIHESPAENWNLDSLAHKAGLSRSVFAKAFHESVGETPHAYLTRWRLGIAAQLLTQTPMSVDEIAKKVGYLSAYTFNRAFKQARGRTPTQERELKSEIIKAPQQ
jgi:AraC-like DNA-binding protein/quercetin dioxygenase-like cupin family protein